MALHLLSRVMPQAKIEIAVPARSAKAHPLMRFGNSPPFVRRAPPQTSAQRNFSGHALRRLPPAHPPHHHHSALLCARGLHLNPRNSEFRDVIEQWSPKAFYAVGAAAAVGTAAGLFSNPYAVAPWICAGATAWYCCACVRVCSRVVLCARVCAFVYAFKMS
jgi:hypothetical protein